MDRKSIKDTIATTQKDNKVPSTVNLAFKKAMGNFGGSKQLLSAFANTLGKD